MTDSVIVTTWVKDYLQAARDMQHSFQHFHPDIPFHLFDWEACQTQLVEDELPGLGFIGAAFGRKLARQGYHTVIHIDGDIIVTAPLTRLFTEAYDVAGVRALPDQGLPDGSKYRRMNRLTGDNLTVSGELNAGFYAAQGVEFWEHWVENNRKYGQKMPLVEQDTLNDLFWSGRYKALLLDPVDCQEYWGTATKWGKALGHGNEMGFLESWRELHMKGDELHLNGKRVHMLHTAGGDWKDKHLGFDAPIVREKFSPEVWEYLSHLRGR